MVFSREEFLTMVNELLYQEEVSYDMLCAIAEKTLWGKIRSWCYEDAHLRGRGYEYDIMQEVHLRLIKTTIPYFLMRNGTNAPVNDDHQGFRSWMFKVAENIKRDFANRVRSNDFRVEPIEDIPDNRPHEDDLDNLQRLQQSMAIVLDANVSIYKSLTWMAHMLLVVGKQVEKVKASAMLEERFQDRTLNEMYRAVVHASDNLRWLEMTDRQKQKLEAALQKPYEEDTPYGETKYCRFFMKKGGKQSISDWVNKLNNLIRRTLENEASEP